MVGKLSVAILLVVLLTGVCTQLVSGHWEGSGGSEETDLNLLPIDDEDAPRRRTPRKPGRHGSKRRKVVLGSAPRDNQGDSGSGEVPQAIEPQIDDEDPSPTNTALWYLTNTPKLHTAPQLAFPTRTQSNGDGSGEVPQAIELPIDYEDPLPTNTALWYLGTRDISVSGATPVDNRRDSTSPATSESSINDDYTSDIGISSGSGDFPRKDDGNRTDGGKVNDSGGESSSGSGSGESEIVSRYADIDDVSTTGASKNTSNKDKLSYIGVRASHRMAKTDLKRVNRYKKYIKSAARHWMIQPSIIAAIMSRESRAGNALDRNGWGDKGNGFGLMQVDKRCHTPQGEPYSYEHILQATGILVDNIKMISKRNETWTEEMKLKGGISAYNGGVGNVRTIENMDIGTTGDDYANDVVARAQWFKRHGY